MIFASISTLMLTSTLVGLAVFILVWTLTTGEIPQRQLDQLSPLEKQRRLSVRKTKHSYHNFEVLVQDLRPIVASFWGNEQLAKLKKSLQFSAVYKDMEADEFLALKSIEGALAGCLVGLIFATKLGLPFAAASILIVLAFYIVIAQGEIAGIESSIKNRFLMRLPASVDLLSLMIEAGAIFPSALETVVRENQGHPIGDQLGQVEREMSLGRPEADALKALRNRMNDPTLDELVMAINEGEELGTPLAKILSSQAERMRLKKSQWIEKAAAEAQVKMSFPSLLIMIACSLVILGPFVLEATFNFFGE